MSNNIKYKILYNQIGGLLAIHTKCSKNHLYNTAECPQDKPCISTGPIKCVSLDGVIREEDIEPLSKVSMSDDEFLLKMFERFRIKLFPFEKFIGIEQNLDIQNEIKLGTFAFVYALSDESKIIRFSLRETIQKYHIQYELLNNSNYIIKTYSYGEYQLQKAIQEDKTISYVDEIKESPINIPKKGVYVILENCNGGDLFDYLDPKKQFKIELIQNESKLRNLIFDIFTAINDVHKVGVIHSDIKQENFLISSIEGDKINIKLADLADCKFIGDAEAIQLDGLTGTPEYIAPETLIQLFRYEYDKNTNGFTFTKKTDVFSAGIILSEILSNVGYFESQFLKKFLEKKIGNLFGILVKRDNNILEEYNKLKKEDISKAQEYAVNEVDKMLMKDYQLTEENFKKKREDIYLLHSFCNNPRKLEVSKKVIKFETLGRVLPFSFDKVTDNIIFDHSKFGSRFLDRSVYENINSYTRDESGKILILDFLEKVLNPSPTQRLSAEEALKHPWMKFDSINKRTKIN